jgi:hypothetical protein
MFFSLQSIDAVVSDEGSSLMCCVQTDHRTAEEIRQQEDISILFALTRVLGARGQGDPQDVQVVYVCAESPPDFLRHAIASAGGVVRIHEGPTLPYDGILSEPEVLADEAFRRLGQRLLRERGMSLDESALVELQRSHAQAPDKEEDELGYWVRVTELAALTGELLRERWGGRWAHMAGLAALPFAFKYALKGTTRSFFANVVGKAERFLNHGEYESLVALLDAGEDCTSPSLQPRSVLLALKAGDWPGKEVERCQPLFERRASHALIPWLVYGEDLPQSFRYFSKEETREQDLDELHSRALENLKAIKLEVEELEMAGSKLLVVAGHYYAAEKVVDVDFMRSLHERLGAAWLMVGVPRRGLLFATGARKEARFLQMFRGLCASQSQGGSGEPICPTPLLLHEGRISGFAEEEDIQAALGAEAPAKPWWGLFSRLFGRRKA